MPGVWMELEQQSWIATVLPLTLFIGEAGAQATDATKAYPNKPIRIVVGFTPGGGPDITARYVAQKLTEAWKQQVIVDNRPGAGGTLGANLVKDGKLIALGVSSPQRDALVPQVPTIAEAGVTGYQSELWFGLLTSSQSPVPIIRRLNNETRRILSESDVKQRWIPMGLEPRPTTPVEFDRLVASDIDLFTKIARAANIRAE